ncbi:hypothetical protein H5410_008822 [Solanum commersonii]|uniref:Uncharacterized protein n=1 Tax=Solanum commersonii TaxID=4109 RepID=A0A9J6AH10_SOLCO|nr:hypothetical protein H5410_008822 [Solanum commersonii]
MGSVINEGGVEEVRVEIKNVKVVKVEIENVEEEMKSKLKKSISDGNSKEEIPPLEIKDYEELGLIVDMGELGDSSYENAGMNFNFMFSGVFLEDEDKLMEITPYVYPVGGAVFNFYIINGIRKMDGNSSTRRVHIIHHWS